VFVSVSAFVEFWFWFRLFHICRSTFYNICYPAVVIL